MVIYSDGGCLGNPGKMYGSFTINGRRPIKVILGEGTNNLAEYKTLHQALKIACQISADPMQTDVVVYIDSALVRNQVGNVGEATWKVKAVDLIPWVNQIKADRMLFKSVTLIQVGRDEIVRVLGH